MGVFKYLLLGREPSGEGWGKKRDDILSFRTSRTILITFSFATRESFSLRRACKLKAIVWVTYWDARGARLSNLMLVSLVIHFVLCSRRCHGGLRCHSGDPLGVPADDGTSGSLPLDRHSQAARISAELPCQLYRWVYYGFKE